ncbi:MAG: hypothetical protein VKI81_04405 [Synechococcaceae cyanobacterium]|nr:hypothetical protein [Synechococcaceae cyanobacterium]
MDILWEALEKIEELQPFFQSSPEDFKARIQHHIQGLGEFPPAQLDNLSVLRVLEVTNGCTQWGFRRNDSTCLSVDRTRECMRVVIGFINDMEISLPSGESIHFQDSSKQLIADGRTLYRDAFKNNVEGAEEEYYAYSTAQFLVYGRQRLQEAMALVKREFEPLFSSYYIQRGAAYIRPYLAALPVGASTAPGAG